MADEQFYGHVTLKDGTHTPLSPEEARALWTDMETAKEHRAQEIPDETAALNTMFNAFERLRELGWREAIYCPKDGSSFDVIEAGSTGIHRCHYEGEWPKGGWWIEADGDLWPSRPILFRLDQEAQAAHDKRMADAVARFAAAYNGGEI